jgi:hypothetical protein
MVIRKHLHASEVTAESEVFPSASHLRRCLQGITLVLIGIGLAREMALCCRSRWKKSGHVSRSVLRTG